MSSYAKLVDGVYSEFQRKKSKSEVMEWLKHRYEDGFGTSCEQELATIKLEGLGIDPKDWGKSKRALQEPCVYCDRKMPWKDEKGLDLRFSDPTVFVYGNRLMIEYDSPYCNDCFEREYEISFCPMCGRKLEV